MANHKIGIPFVISGPSGSGKGMIVREILKRDSENYRLSVSATTRQPRPGERDGVEYYFISRKEFEDRIAAGEVLEYTEYCGNYYGTLKSEVENLTEAGINVILEIEIVGGNNVRRIRPDTLLFFVIPPDADTLRKRLRGRGTESEESIEKRLARAEKEILLAKDYDYLIVNETDRIGAAADEIMQIVEAEKHRMRYHFDRVAHLFDPADPVGEQ
ncbi:MAG: guanylate kinase [Clostridia bacterium]|nr:guanylate kinase [Clostridia bacterium]